MKAVLSRQWLRRGWVLSAPLFVWLAYLAALPLSWCVGAAALGSWAVLVWGYGDGWRVSPPPAQRRAG
jgi:hypothetical protein